MTLLGMGNVGIVVDDLAAAIAFFVELGLELMQFQRPTAVRAEPKNAPANTLGIRRIMFAVDDIEDVLNRLRAHGAELVGELAQYAVRGPVSAMLRPQP